jgi:anti-sigma B factor antagonist
MHEPYDGTRAPRSRELTIETTSAATRVELTLAGELDLVSAPKLEAELMAVETSDAGNLLIDLEGVQFVDSTGLRVLLGAARRAAVSEHKLALRHVDGQVRRLFEMAGVVEQFSFDSD